MIKIRNSSERGYFDHGWLKTYHTFSFGDYLDPTHMGYRSLRVINEDWVAPGMGFPTHSHRDMEIITYVLEGEVEHKDSMGNRGLIRPGDVQRMSAGRGVTHSEANPSPKNKLHLLQIWILPSAKNIPPSYEQKSFSSAQKANRFCLVASPDGSAGSVKIHQDARLYVAQMDAGHKLTWTGDMKPSSEDRPLWVQVAKGEIEINGLSLQTSDGAAISEMSSLEFSSKGSSEILLFELGS